MTELDAANFSGLMTQLRSCSFSSEKVDLIRQVSTRYIVSAEHLGQILGTLSFSSEKMEAIECFRDKIKDPLNMEPVIKHLTFASEKEEARKLLIDSRPAAPSVPMGYPPSSSFSSSGGFPGGPSVASGTFAFGGPGGFSGGYSAAPGSGGYGAVPGFGAAPPGYGAAPPGYGAAPPGYGAAPPGYGAATGSTDFMRTENGLTEVWLLSKPTGIAYHGALAPFLSISEFNAMVEKILSVERKAVAAVMGDFTAATAKLGFGMFGGISSVTSGMEAIMDAERESSLLLADLNKKWNPKGLNIRREREHGSRVGRGQSPRSWLVFSFVPR